MPSAMARRDRRQYDTDRNLAAWLADEAHPENREAYDYLVGLEQEGQLDDFTGDILRKTRRWGPMSERQRDAVLRSKARRAEFQARREAEAEQLRDVAPLAEGRRTIVGEIVSTKLKDTPYGEQLKMLVRQADGNKVWGSVPQALIDLTTSTYYWDVETQEYSEQAAEVKDLRGATVELTATVKRSDTDPHFGFYSRPSNAQLLGAAVVELT